MGIREDQQRLIGVNEELSKAAAALIQATDALRVAHQKFVAVVGNTPGRASQISLRINNFGHTISQYPNHVQGLKTDIAAYAANLGK